MPVPDARNHSYTALRHRGHTGAGGCQIARQSVPEGYGNSYFWVKPDRIVPLRYVREVGGRLNFLGEELRPLDEDSVRAAARFFRDAGISAVGICLIHSYANPAHERRAGRGAAHQEPAAPGRCTRAGPSP